MFKKRLYSNSKYLAPMEVLDLAKIPQASLIRTAMDVNGTNKMIQVANSGGIFAVLGASVHRMKNVAIAEEATQ